MPKPAECGAASPARETRFALAQGNQQCNRNVCYSASTKYLILDTKSQRGGLDFSRDGCSRPPLSKDLNETRTALVAFEKMTSNSSRRQSRQAGKTSPAPFKSQLTPHFGLFPGLPSFWPRIGSWPWPVGAYNVCHDAANHTIGAIRCYRPARVGNVRIERQRAGCYF